MNNPFKLSPVFDKSRTFSGEYVDNAGWHVPAVFTDLESERFALRHAICLADQSANGKLRVQGADVATVFQAEALAVNAGVQMAYGQLYRLRRDLFHVRTFPGSEKDAAEQLERLAEKSREFVTISDVTHANAELWLCGHGCTDLLGRLCGLDFQEEQFANWTARQSSVAKTTQLIIRQDLDGIPAFALIGARSLGAYLWETLLQAGQDSDIQPIGQNTLKDVWLTE